MYLASYPTQNVLRSPSYPASILAEQQEQGTYKEVFELALKAESSQLSALREEDIPVSLLSRF